MDENWIPVLANLHNLFFFGYLLILRPSNTGEEQLNRIRGLTKLATMNHCQALLFWELSGASVNNRRHF
jgi:hypothetical protein